MRILALLLCHALFAQGSDDAVDIQRIATLIKHIASNDLNQIVSEIHFPLIRPYPIKPIKSKQECLRRFDEVFDEKLLSEIATSDVKGDDWQRIGWRGIGFKNGSLWLNDDYKISCVNHETKKTMALKKKLIDEEKQLLPIALRDFDEPVFEWKTHRYLIRVDKKQNDYRLVIFKGHTRARVLQELYNGVFRFEGTMGSFLIDWQSNGKTHRVYSSGESDENDCYYRYDSLVDQADWPDHPEIEQKRRR